MPKTRILCDACGKRPALMFRRTHKRNGNRRSRLVIKASADHPLCVQCHNTVFESMRQAAHANTDSPRAEFEEKNNYE